MIELDEDVKARIVANVGTSSWTREAVVKAAIDAVLSHLNTECAAMFEKPDPYLVMAREVCQAFIDAADSRDAEEAAIADYLRERDERLIEAMQVHWGPSVVGYLKAEMAKS